MRVRPASLLWLAIVGLGLAVLILRLRVPGHPALPGLTLALLGLLALRIVAMALAWRRSELPGTRLLLPGILLVEGLGLTLAGREMAATSLKMATAAALEILFIVLAARALRQARARPHAWPEETLTEAFLAFVPPKAARMIALEAVVLGSSFRFLFGGFRKPTPPGFSHHLESTLRAILPALPLMIPGDLLLVHTLMGRFPSWTRGLVHFLDLYALAWLLGLYATLKARPHQVNSERVDLHMGILGGLSFERSSLKSALRLQEFEDRAALRAFARGAHRLVRPGTPLVELQFHEPVSAVGLLGTPGPALSRVIVSVDDPHGFIAALGAA